MQNAGYKVKMCRYFYEETYDIFDENGIEKRPEDSLGLRNRLNYALSYLATNYAPAIALANKIIQNCTPAECHFSPAVSMQILLKYEHLLEPSALAFLNQYLEDHFVDMMIPDLDFISINDNFPALATMSLLLGGERFHKPKLYALGVNRLHQLEALLMRRGFTSEFNSPTYTAIQLLAIAEIANYAQDPAIAELAKWCEQQIWYDIILHYHTSLQQIVGPYSRAYTVDSMASLHQAEFLLYAAFGDVIRVNPMIQHFEGKPQAGDAVHGSIANMQKSAVWFASTEYHIPEDLAPLVQSKEFPFTVSATVETGPSTDAPGLDTGPSFPFVEYPGGEGIIRSYMTETYGLGTATREWHNGNHTDSIHLIYKKADEVRTQSDVGAMYMRYLINGGEPNPAVTLLPDKGRKLCMQEKGNAVAIYKPRLYNGRCKNFEDVTSMKLSVIFTEDCTPCVQNISHNRTAAFIQLQNIYIALIPLAVTNLGRKTPIAIEKANGLTMVSFYNYEGPKKSFTKRSFLKVCNGVAVIVKEAKEYDDFAQFVHEASKTKVTDSMYQYELTRMALVRQVQVTFKEDTLACAYTPTSEGLQYLTLNRLPYEFCLNGKTRHVINGKPKNENILLGVINL